MGQSNLLAGLKSKLASLTGEADALDERIGRIKADYATLAELEARLLALREGVAHVAAVIRLDHEGFDETTVTPRKPYTHRLPVKLGECSKTALDILRTATEPMTSRQIALVVLERYGITAPESAVKIATTNAVDSSLRAHKGKIVNHDDNWPKRWWIEIESGGRGVSAPKPLPALPVALPLARNRVV